MSRVAEYFTKLKFPKKYQSIIDADIYLFGLIYFILFEKKEFDLNNDLSNTIQNRIEKLREDKSHIKSPNQKKHVASRISESVKIYREYITNE